MILKHRVLIANELMAELAATVAKPRMDSKVRWDDYKSLVDDLLEYGTKIAIAPTLPHCRDPKDSYLLAVARDGEADFLVTNDQDLLCLSSFGKCEVVTPEEFASRLALMT